MNGIERKPARGEGNPRYQVIPAVIRDLPLVIPDQAHLGQPAEIFLQRKNLPKSPFHGEGLAGRYVAELSGRHAGGFSLPVDFPVGKQVCAGPFVFRDVESRARRYVVPPVSGPYIVARARSVSACGSREAVSGIEVSSLEVPTQIHWLDVSIGKT